MLNPRSFVAVDSSTSKMQDPADYIEDVVCTEDDIKENEMKAFDLKDVGKVLLIRQNGQLSAIGNKCSHYGAPLVNGALGQGYVRCQWHGACFNILTGDIEDFPGLDSLPCYQVSIENKNVKIRAKRSELQLGKRVKLMAKEDSQAGTSMVVIGGGPSGAVCVETLRQEGFTGKITLINKENCLPYDRIKISKVLDADIAKLQFRNTDFYNEHNIDVLQNVEATQVDTANRKVVLSNGATVNYDSLYIATGCKPRALQVPGSNNSEVHVLRGFADSQKIFAQLSPEKDVVCLGGSFISMEAATSCVGKAKSVTVVFRGEAPFAPVFGEEVGKRVMQLFGEKGIKFIVNSGIKSCVEEEGKLAKVELMDGSFIPCNVCITGLGSTFYTEFLNKSGLELNPDGSLTVNECLETNVKGVFAGGDIANAPVYSSGNSKSAIGHFPLAHYHGKIAALNMLGKTTPVKNVPYFWTMLFGKSLRYAGHGRADEIKIYGDLAELKYYAYHFKGDEVIAMSSCTYDPLVSKFANYLLEGKKLVRSDLVDDPLAWSK